MAPAFPQLRCTIAVNSGQASEQHVQGVGNIKLLLANTTQIQRTRYEPTKGRLYRAQTSNSLTIDNMGGGKLINFCLLEHKKCGQMFAVRDKNNLSPCWPTFSPPPPTSLGCHYSSRLHSFTRNKFTCLHEQLALLEDSSGRQLFSQVEGDEQHCAVYSWYTLSRGRC